MLVEFTVGNYRSIKDPATLSAVATKQRKTAASGKRRPGVVPDEEIAPAYPVEGRGFGLLPVLGIFGANASGKSNVLRALDNCLTLITSGTVPPQKASFVPFLLGEPDFDKPIEFRIEITAQGNLYTYQLQVTRSHIVHEQLAYTATPARRFHMLYDRQWIEQTRKYVWRKGADFRGDDMKMKDEASPDQPFLAVLVYRYCSDVVQPLIDWLLLRYPGVGLDSINQDYDFVVKTLSGARRDYLSRVSTFVRVFDTGVQEIQIGTTSDSVIFPSVVARHDTVDGGRLLSMDYESTGTKRLFTLAFQVISTIETGSLLIIDELEHNLHPHITHAIVKMFQDPNINPKRAQLIFTSHDNTLLRNNLLRRDQIWFTEKRRNQSTELYPLSDYRLRNDQLIDLGYLHGRFGGVPVLPADYDLGELLEAGRR